MVTSGRDTSGAHVGPQAMGVRLLSPLLPPTARSLTVGIVVATTLIGAETLLVYLLERVAPGMAFGVVYLLGTQPDPGSVFSLGLAAFPAILLGGLDSIIGSLVGGLCLVGHD